MLTAILITLAAGIILASSATIARFALATWRSARAGSARGSDGLTAADLQWTVTP